MSIANNNIEIDDLVRIRWPLELKKVDSDVRYIVKGIPTRVNMADTWWTLIGQDTGAVWIVASPVVLEVLS